ncbi:MAG: hypothetical protein WC373_08245 [Smithella sp.]|jgi:hypothetical protein
MNIHIIEPLNKFIKLPDDKWEIGWWSIDESKAKDLVGGEIYFHKKQQEPSFFGGSIIGYRIDQDAQHEGKIVFTFQYNATCRNVKTDKRGWSKKMKMICND